MNNKESFHRQGKKFLKQIALIMKFAPDSFEIRSNKGGPAVRGEVTLHHEQIYIQFCDIGILFRTCKGRKDYCGGPNNWAQYEELGELYGLCHKFRALMERGEINIPIYK